MRVFASFGLVAALAASGTSSFAQARFSAPSAGAVHQRAADQQPAAFPEDARVAYVDVDRVAALSAEGKAASAKLNELRSKKSAEMAERSKQVEALQQKLDQSASVLNEVARAQLQREFRRAQLDLQMFSQDAQAEVQEAQQQALQAFNAQLFPVLREVATEKKLWAVFSNDSGLLWYNPATDLTDEVVKRLDAAAKPGR